MTSVMAGPHAGDPLTLPDDGVDYMRAAESMRRDFRVAYSPNLGDFPIDTRVAEVVRSATEALARNGVKVDEAKLDFGTDYDTLARLWVRTISVHYGAIARHWKEEGVDLLGKHAEKLTPQFRRRDATAQCGCAGRHGQGKDKGFHLLVSFPSLA
jgi:amidase/aspartyl-tRNA(Asn)/glutamyl-tRNA(Gln) amidotransferase subunit A